MPSPIAVAGMTSATVSELAHLAEARLVAGLGKSTNSDGSTKYTIPVVCNSLYASCKYITINSGSEGLLMKMPE